MYSQALRSSPIHTPHGSVKAHWDAQILTIHTQGPFNLEGIHQGGMLIRNAVKNRKHDQWLRLDIADNESLGEPGVIDAITSNYLWSFKNGCKAMALVYCNSLQKALYDNFMQDQSINFKAFYTIGEANDWLEHYANSSEIDINKVV